jgi:hypothetical protein
MKRLISNIRFKIYMKFYFFWLRGYFKISSLAWSCILEYLYIEACDEYPKSRLFYRRELAIKVSGILCERAGCEPMCELDPSEAEDLKAAMVKNAEIRAVLGDYFRLRLTAYSKAATGTFGEEIRAAQAGALKFAGVGDGYSDSENSNVKKLLNAKKNKLIAESRLRSKARIDELKLEVLPPRVVSGADGIFVFSLFSTLLFTGGFIYAKFSTQDWDLK